MGSAKTVLGVAALVSLLMAAMIFACFRRQQYTGTITLVSDDPGSPFLHLVFDAKPDPLQIPLGQNRGYWIDGRPPEGMCRVAVKGDRMVYRWDRVQVPFSRRGLDLIEYRLLKGERIQTFSEDSALEFWGIVVAIILAPTAVGALVVAILGFSRP